MKKIIILNIKFKQTLGDCLVVKFGKPHLPTNTIVYKNVTGIGATYSEIHALRNSVIIEPNVPVIIGKIKKHKQIFGVYEDVEVCEIIEYLLDDNIKYKKLVSTPESYWKIKNAFFMLDINYHLDYVIMFDECEKLVTDVNYRNRIIEPLDDFFNYVNKIFVSATVLEMKDPRFEVMDELYVIPIYDARRDITIIHTNNSLDTLREIIEQDRTNCQYLIFFDSLIGASSFINTMKININSSIFASDTTLKRLKSSFNINHKSSTLDVSKFSRYNFFTSRFFSAVDFDTKHDCKIVILSEIYIASHSRIDPETQALQIIGRVRDNSLIKEVTIITNTNSEILYYDEADAKEFLNKSHEVYLTILGIKETANNPITIQVIDSILDVLPYKEYMRKDGHVNHFMYDYFLYENRINKLYTDFSLLKQVYLKATLKGSDKKLFNVKSIIEKIHPIDSSLYKYDSPLKRYRDELKVYVEILDKVNLMSISDPNRNGITEVIKREAPEILEAYSICDRAKLLRCYTREDVIALSKRSLDVTNDFDLGFIKELKTVFYEGKVFTSLEGKRYLIKILKDHGLIHKFKVSIETLKKFFDITRVNITTKDNRLIKAYRIKQYNPIQ
jgi:hypothetical protein